MSKVIWPDEDLTFQIDPYKGRYLIYDDHNIRKCLKNWTLRKRSPPKVTLRVIPSKINIIVQREQIGARCMWELVRYFHKFAESLMPENTGLARWGSHLLWTSDSLLNLSNCYGIYTKRLVDKWQMLWGHFNQQKKVNIYLIFVVKIWIWWKGEQIRQKIHPVSPKDISSKLQAGCKACKIT